jgi:NAD-dependent SIR2 family protein deacetylase
MDAGAPSQAKIVEAIYSLKQKYNGKKYSTKVNDWIESFDLFLKEALCISDEEKFNYSLEDIYTPIDRSLYDNISYRNYTTEDLFKLRDSFNRLVMLAVRNEIQESNKSRFTVNQFAEYLVRVCKTRMKNEQLDQIAVITTNWDIMLDNALHSRISEDPVPKGRHFNGVVDYCCYISSLSENDHKIKPGLYALGKGGYNVKVLKLHGSLNWLQCPKCQRIYVKFYEKWNAGYVFDQKYCRHCERNFSAKRNESHRLFTNLITPTFLKNLNNVQNKLIWQNAGLELAEATKVVFMGYSLPQADFEFKQLLSRMIRSDAKIEVVLTKSSNPKNEININQPYLTAGYRYNNFFSGRKIKIYYDGVRKYVRGLK